MNNYHQGKHYSKVLRPPALMKYCRNQPEITDIKDDTENKCFKKYDKSSAYIFKATSCHQELRQDEKNNPSSNMQQHTQPFSLLCHSSFLHTNLKANNFGSFFIHTSVLRSDQGLMPYVPDTNRKIHRSRCILQRRGSPNSS